MFTTLVCYGLIGAAVGLLAGLFGVGGGTIIVPMLIMAFNWQAIPQEFIMHLALGTSLASILFTSIASTLAHNRHRGVDWGIVKRIVPGILAGTYGGSFVAAYIPSSYLQILFTLFLFYVSANMFRSKKTEASPRARFCPYEPSETQPRTRFCPPEPSETQPRTRGRIKKRIVN